MSEARVNSILKIISGAKEPPAKPQPTSGEVVNERHVSVRKKSQRS